MIERGGVIKKRTRGPSGCVFDVPGVPGDLEG